MNFREEHCPCMRSEMCPRRGNLLQELHDWFTQKPEYQHIVELLLEFEDGVSIEQAEIKISERKEGMKRLEQLPSYHNYCVSEKTKQKKENENE